MTDGTIHIYNGMILTDSGAIATADACCCDAIEYGDDCSGCFDADETPLYMTVVFSGVTACPDSGSIGGHTLVCRQAFASALNGTHKLTQDGTDPCLWTTTVAVDSCATVRIFLACTSGTWDMYVDVSPQANTVYYDAACTASASSNDIAVGDCGGFGAWAAYAMCYGGSATIAEGDQT